MFTDRMERVRAAMTDAVSPVSVVARLPSLLTMSVIGAQFSCSSSPRVCVPNNS